MSTDAQIRELLATLGAKPPTPPKAPPDTVAFMQDFRAAMAKHAGEEDAALALLSYLPLVLLIRNVVRFDGLDPDTLWQAAKTYEESVK